MSFSSDDGARPPLGPDVSDAVTVVPATDPRVDSYIDALPDWQQAICREIRELIHAADPEIVETIKRTVQPYFVLEGNIARAAGGKRPRQCLPVRPARGGPGRDHHGRP